MKKQIVMLVAGFYHFNMPCKSWGQPEKYTRYENAYYGWQEGIYNTALPAGHRMVVISAGSPSSCQRVQVVECVFRGIQSKKHTFGFWVDNSHLSEGYHVVRKHNGKKVPFRVEYCDGYDYITCRSWAERRHIQRKVFGWARGQ